MTAVSYHDLLDAFAQPGCPVCRLSLRATERLIAGINRDLVNAPDIWDEVMASFGFCNLHAEQWLHAAHPLGTAYIYEALLDRISTRIEQIKPGGMRGRFRNGKSADLIPERACVICTHRDEQESLLIATLLKGFRQDGFGERYLRSAGLCFPHLRRALGAAEEETCALLRRHALDQQARLRQELKEVIRKHDYRFQDEPMGDERDAPERAVHQIAGAFGINDRPERK